MNKLLKGAPGKSTTQAGMASFSIKDTINLTGIRPAASDAAAATATFRLYSADTCAAASLVYTSDPVTLTYGGTPVGATASATLAGFQPISAGTTYYWRVTYTGDAFNNGFTTACGSETAFVSFTFSLVP